MQRIYQGNYFEVDKNGEQCPVLFRMEVELDKRMSFTGTVWEAKFSGYTGKNLSVKGFIDNDHISFIKSYPCLFEYDNFGNIVVDETKSGHEVIYDGYWNDNDGIWVGEWEVQGETVFFQPSMIKNYVYLGKFEMNMLK